jgi:hypothetical protein
MTPALADHLNQAAPGVLVVLVCLQVFRQLMDAGGQQRDLYFR